MINFPKAKRITKKHLEEFLEMPGNKEVYRQTRNDDSGNWLVPKFRLGKNKWRAIKNRHLVVEKGGRGNTFAIWRIWAIKSHLKIAKDKPMWRCSDIYTISNKKYTIYYMICWRIKYDIRGAD
jgi:hypothetical protein